MRMANDMKKILCFLLSIITVLLLCASAFAGGQTVRNVNDVWELGEGAEPDIYKAELYKDGAAVWNVFCVVCDGMAFDSIDPNDARSITNAAKISLSCENNAYVRTVCSAIEKAVPDGADVVLLGRSMGGMVVQQVMAQNAIKADYNILDVLAVGSPYIYTKNTKEGTLRRVADRMDIVPFLSIAGLTNPIKGNVSMETSWVLPNVHMDGYRLGTCWKNYDCLGVKGGSAYLELGEKVFG